MRSPHQLLKEVGKRRIFRGMRTGGYEEQDCTCEKCDTKFTYSNDKNDCSWLLHKSPFA
jgi:hypothetical protein